MTDYKSQLYGSYVTTHTAHRKGAGSLEDFKNRVIINNQQLNRFLPNNFSAKILDIGCGNGSVVWWLQQSGYTEASGIDISQEQVNIGLELGVKNIVCADLMPFLEQHKNEFDLIIARDILEHFTKTQVVQILQLTKQALTTTGRLLIHVPNGESPFFGRVRYGDYTHELAFTSNSIKQIGKQYGYARVEVYPSFFYGGGIRETIRRWMWLCVQRCYKTLLYIETGKNNYIVTQNLLAVLHNSDSANV